MEWKWGWKFERVERIAGFSREDVSASLKMKASRGNCGCDEKKGRRAKIRCKTICGTLLGPDAKDAQQPPVEGPPPFGAKERASPDAIRRALEAGAPRKR